MPKPRRCALDCGATRAAGVGLLFAVFLAACDGYTPEPVADAVIQLPFEDDLSNLAPLALRGEAHDSRAAYADSETGTALETFGKGGWIEIHPEEPVRIRGSMEVSFDFKRADWINPYKSGSASQTMVHLRGRSPKKIVHLTFGIRPGNEPALTAFIEGTGGQKHRFRARKPLTLGWHTARLLFDADAKQVTLFLDDEKVDSVSTTPLVYTAGIDRIKFGTWFKKNQAYKGLIDNFVLRDIAR